MSDSLEGEVARAGAGARKRKKKKKMVLGIGPRLALIALLVGFTVVACAGIAAKIAQPYQMMRAERSQMASLKDGLQATQAQNDSLARQDAYLRSPEGIETTARSQGYVKPGEVSLIIEQPAAPAAAAAPNGFADRIRQAWDHVIGK